MADYQPDDTLPPPEAYDDVLYPVTLPAPTDAADESTSADAAMGFSSVNLEESTSGDVALLGNSSESGAALVDESLPSPNARLPVRGHRPHAAVHRDVIQNRQVDMSLLHARTPSVRDMRPAYYPRSGRVRVLPPVQSPPEQQQTLPNELELPSTLGTHDRESDVSTQAYRSQGQRRGPSNVLRPPAGEPETPSTTSRPRRQKQKPSVARSTKQRISPRDSSSDSAKSSHSTVAPQRKQQPRPKPKPKPKARRRTDVSAGGVVIPVHHDFAKPGSRSASISIPLSQSGSTVTSTPGTSDPALLLPTVTSGSTSSRSRSRSRSISGPLYMGDGRQRAETSFLDQLFSALDREFTQMLRRPCATIMSVVGPLLFVLVAVILWAVWGMEGSDTEVLPVNYSAPLVELQPSMPTTSALFCNNVSSGVIIPGMLPCDEARGGPFTCDGVEEGLPYGNRSFCTYGPDFRLVLFNYFVSTMGNVTLIPSLDTMIQYKWAALKCDCLLKSDNLAQSFQTDRQVYSMLQLGQLFFVGGDEEVVQTVREGFRNSSVLFDSVDGGHYANMADAKKAAAEARHTWAIVELRGISTTGLDAVIHMNAQSVVPTSMTVDIQFSGGVAFNGISLYLTSGFLTIQQAVSEIYLTHFHNTTVEATNYIASVPFPAYSYSPMLSGAYQLVPLIFVLAFLSTTSSLVKKAVLEKEMRIREAMLIMGMMESALYLTSFFVALIPLFIVSAVATLVVHATFLGSIEIWFLFLAFFLFAISTIPLAGLIAAFFSKARLASLMAPVIYFIVVIPSFIMGSATGAPIIVFSFFSPSAFASIITIFLRHELGSGFAASDMQNPYDDPNVTILVSILAADFFIYYILMLYFDAVLPKDWGTPKHPLFFIIDPFRACCGGGTKILEGGPDGRDETGVFEEGSYEDDVVQLRGLRKEYKRGGKSFVAVNNVYWGMREGEISVMLGHNGAGKTTVLNMMTGMIEPDEGDCAIFGLSVRQELSLVRSEVGFCPQHNILWPELTCRDHLEFYGRIKGLKGWELEDAVFRMLKETDLIDKRDYKSKDLSGGQKRKLSISIAFVGGGRLVFLDEPTAGMDVGARRYLWGMLKKMSHNHTILLTTHFMDEADLLGHRIGIMSHGRLRCSGSSLFLKSHLGVGYSLVVSINPDVSPDEIDELVSAYVEGAVTLNRNGCELTYQLPLSEAEVFPQLLTAMEEQDKDLGIRGYSLAATTLEEVFLKVSEETQGEGGDDEKPTIAPIWDYETTTSPISAQMRAMFKKRFWNALRDRRMQCFQLITPVVCILVAMLLALITATQPDTAELSYDALFRNDASAAKLFTAQCDALWGESPTLAGASVNETHYPNAEQLSWFLLDYWYFHEEPIYGAIACDDRDLASQASSGLANMLLYNSSSPHQSAVNLASYYGLLLDHVSDSSASMHWHMGLLDESSSVPDAFKMLITGILIMIPFTFLPSNPVAWIVKERECGAMHQQRLAGINFYVYWFCNFVFDFAAYVLVIGLIMAVFAIFRKEEFISSEAVGPVFLVFMLYGLTSTVMSYMVSFLFSEHSAAQTTVMGGNFAIGFLLLIVAYVLALKPETEDTANLLRAVFSVVPSFAVGDSVCRFMLYDQLYTAGMMSTLWERQGILINVICLAAELPVFAVVTLLLDSPAIKTACQRRSYSRDSPPVLPSDEDSDVEEERKAVYDVSTKEDDNADMVRVMDLQKRYGNGKMAVKGVTFSIFPGEVFAFLGTNGAGKTTTMSMLCQQFLPSGGSAHINGYDIVEESAEALQCVGYCPQFDATFDLLTVEEHLEYYAALHGVARESRDEVVETLLQLCELTRYRESQAAQLSGGNRRKLSVAISLMGGPEVIFLDEPSAGMDPVARRGMWTTIQRASKHCSVVLTTHHLEEVEALADIVAIMVDGTLRCIGDKIHLKNKFGSGFEMSLRIGSEDQRMRVEEFVTKNFPSASLNEFKSNRFVYELPRDASLSDIFAVLQQNKDYLGITDYSVSQTSIEQVFLQVGAKALANDD